jgi:hypothetical protein
MIPDARMTLVVEGPVGNAIQELNQLELVKSIKIIH